MIGDLRTVVVTFRPRTGVDEDLTQWAAVLTRGLNTARVTNFDGEAAVTARVRVRTTRRAAAACAEQWVRDQIGNLSLDLLRVQRVDPPPETVPPILLLNDGVRPDRWPKLRMLATELGWHDLGHKVAKDPWRHSGRPLAAAMQDSDATTNAVANTSSRRYLGAAPNAKAPIRGRVLNSLLSLVALVVPAVSAGVLAHDPNLLRVLGLLLSVLAAVLIQVGTFFTNEIRMLATRLVAAIGLTGSVAFLGAMLGGSDQIPTLRFALATAVVGAYGAGLLFAADAHRGMLRPLGMAALVAPILAGGAMLLYWSFEGSSQMRV